VQAALAAAGATLHDVVRWTIAIVDGHPPAAGFAAFREAWGDAANTPAISVHIVSGLARPQFLVEIDAVAASPGLRCFGADLFRVMPWPGSYRVASQPPAYPQAGHGVARCAQPSALERRYSSSYGPSVGYRGAGGTSSAGVSVR
jgi:hypothetical protein